MEVATTTPAYELVPQLRFPPGFRFVPTEAELVDDYLRAKIEGHELPLKVINDVPILEWQPGQLVEKYKGYGENRWFFFTVREQSSSNKDKEPSRKVKAEAAGGVVTATWKATGSVQLIRRKRSKDGDKVVVGTKRVLIYSSNTAENGKWSMHEYVLEGHAAIGQYALYSIQRKQHSDTEGNDDMDPEKKKTRKRKRTEQVQLPHPETTALLAEPPLKPTRKAKTQRKKKTSMQVGIEGEQQQQKQSPMEPVTPPKKDELAPSQQEGRQQQPSAPAVPAVRVYPPSEPDGTLGASAPKLEEDTFDDDRSRSQLVALLYPGMFCNNNQGRQEQWRPPSLTGNTAFLAAADTNVVVGHARLQPYHHQYQQPEDGYISFAVQNQHVFLGENQSVYMEQAWQHADPLLPDNTTTQTMNSGGGGWMHGNDQRQIQIHQQPQQEENNGGGFGVVQDQQPMNHPQGGHNLPPSDEQSSGSDHLQVDSRLLLVESVQMVDDVDGFVRDVLEYHDEPPQDSSAGTQEQLGGGDDPAATLQAAGTQEQGVDDTVTLQQHDELQRHLASFQLQLQAALNEQVRDGPCSCRNCAAGLRHYCFFRGG